MIKIINNYIVQADARGSFHGLINQGVWKEMNLIETRASVTRGNHYHEKTLELFIILKGEIQVVTQLVKNRKLYGEIFEDTVQAGDVFLIEPMVNHTFQVRTDSTWINVLSEKMDRDDEDMHRVDG